MRVRVCVCERERERERERKSDKTQRSRMRIKPKVRGGILMKMMKKEVDENLLSIYSLKILPLLWHPFNWAP